MSLDEHPSTVDDDAIVDLSQSLMPELRAPPVLTTIPRECHPTGPISDLGHGTWVYHNSCLLYPVYSTFVPVQLSTLNYPSCYGFGKLGAVTNGDSSEEYKHISIDTAYGGNKQWEKLHLKHMDDLQRKPNGFMFEVPKGAAVAKPISERQVFHSRVSKDKPTQGAPTNKSNCPNSSRPRNDSEFEPRVLSATGALNSLRAGSGFSSELQAALYGYLDLEGMDDLEKEMASDLRNHPPHCIRRGSVMSNFTYLLLDPRVTRNLPGRAKSLDDRDVMATFVRSIFYVGKGQGKRSYSHLRTAHAQFYKRQPGCSPEVSGTLQHILDIWTSGHGVVSVPLFHNTVAIEAHTREACMIEAIGLLSLTNRRRGVFYGQSRSWTRETKCMMGVYLLKRALQIFLCEGERPIGPRDIS